MDGGLYRVHLDVEEHDDHKTPNFNPAVSFMDQTAISMEGIRPDSAAYRVSVKGGRYGSNQRKEDVMSVNNSIEGGGNRKSSALNHSGRLVLSRERGNEIYGNLMPAQIGNDLERNNSRLMLNSQENEDLSHHNQHPRYFYNGGNNSTSHINFKGNNGRSTSLISPANMSMTSNDHALIVHEGRKVQGQHPQMALNKVSSAYRQDLTQIMKQQ